MSKGSRNRVKNRKAFGERFDEIDMSKRSSPPMTPKRVKAGKVTYVYGK